MSLSKDKRLYNYVVNTLGVSKKMIYEYVDYRIQQLFDNLSFDYIESYCKAEVNKRLDKMVSDNLSWDIRRKIEKEITKHLKTIDLEGKVKVTYKPKIDVDIDMRTK